MGRFVVMGLVLAVLGPSAAAQERPYFVTYDHYLEEPRTLELELNPLYGSVEDGNDFVAGSMELEYGATAWWTTELYLDGQHTEDDSTVFTGFRWENRFRPTTREHAINPILYVEYEDVNGADKVLSSVVGHDVAADFDESNADLKDEVERELELKLILSSAVSGWNISENLIAVKNLTNEPWEFGYAFGVSRPLALAATAGRCAFCPENFVAGLELYGGLGDAERFGLNDTSQYLAPLIAWNLPSSMTLKLSPGWGLNDDSLPFVLRFGFAIEFPGLGRR